MNNIYKVLKDIYDLKLYPSKCQNERYLHHYFSKEIQKYYFLDLENINNSKFHPEWPTFKKATKLNYGRYKKDSNNKYQVCDEGTAGFIDFVLGDYDKPKICVEFTSKYGWSNEEIVYDFLKILDERNPFEISISYNVILKTGDLSKGKYLENIQRKLNEARK